MGGLHLVPWHHLRSLASLWPLYKCHLAAPGSCSHPHVCLFFEKPESRNFILQVDCILKSSVVEHGSAVCIIQLDFASLKSNSEYLAVIAQLDSLDDPFCLKLNQVVCVIAVGCGICDFKWITSDADALQEIPYPDKTVFINCE